ncbi:recombinase family protein [Candidatus Margulisiibacteriota bacterium]
MAKKYVDNLSEETKKGMLEKTEQGTYPSMAPYGYTNNKLDKTIEVSDPEADVVHKMYEWYSTGEYSLKDIRNKAKQEGLLEGLTKYKVSTSTIDKMLKSVFYTGNFIWKGKQYKGNHMPIIDKGLWETIQQI